MKKLDKIDDNYKIDNDLCSSMQTFVYKHFLYKTFNHTIYSEYYNRGENNRIIFSKNFLAHGRFCHSLNVIS